MKFAYQDLSDGQFEELIIILCQQLLGSSVKGFAKGPDGGKDAKFVGTAQRHPSTAEPWIGTVIVQAKHTNGYNRHFGESDFFSPGSKTTQIGFEVPRIRRLRQDRELDHYMLFANRRLAGDIDQVITKHISEACDIPKASIYLCGVEQLEMYMKQFPMVATLADLDPIDSPLIVSPDELAIVVEAIANNTAEMAAPTETPPELRTSYAEKNVLNNMTPGYAIELRKRYLRNTAQIGRFLAAPENQGILQSYEASVEEFQLKILAKRKDHQNFDAVIEYLADLLFQRDPILRQRKHKRLTRAILFYMYWNCDIGVSKSVEA